MYSQNLSEPRIRVGFVINKQTNKKQKATNKKQKTNKQKRIVFVVIAQINMIRAFFERTAGNRSGCEKSDPVVHCTIRPDSGLHAGRNVLAIAA